jgi:hypothetical protein
MREPNHADADLALRLYDLRREHELRKARRLIGDLSTGGWEDVHAVMDWDHKENAHFRQATSYWEMAASFVNRGVLHPDVYLDTCGEGLFTYTAFKPHLAKIRETSPRFLVQTEKLIAERPSCAERVAQLETMMAAWKSQLAAAAAAKREKKDKKKGRK